VSDAGQNLRVNVMLGATGGGPPLAYGPAIPMPAPSACHCGGLFQQCEGRAHHQALRGRLRPGRPGAAGAPQRRRARHHRSARSGRRPPLRLRHPHRARGGSSLGGCGASLYRVDLGTGAPRRPERSEMAAKSSSRWLPCRLRPEPLHPAARLARRLGDYVEPHAGIC
jgi:hypothetical protein